MLETNIRFPRCSNTSNMLKLLAAPRVYLLSSTHSLEVMGDNLRYTFMIFVPVNVKEVTV